MRVACAAGHTHADAVPAVDGEGAVAFVDGGAGRVGEGRGDSGANVGGGEAPLGEGDGCDGAVLGSVVAVRHLRFCLDGLDTDVNTSNA